MSVGPGKPTQFILLDEVASLKWAARRRAALWQAVVLHSWLDPDLLCDGWPASFERDQLDAVVGELLRDGTVSSPDQLVRRIPKAGSDPQLQLLHNLTVAAVALSAGSLPRLTLDTGNVLASEVSLSEFLGWSLRTGLPVVKGFSPRTITQPISRWPWGSHTTKKLDLLAEAGEHWRLKVEGGTYDPDDPFTAPRSEVIEEWLTCRGIPTTVAKAMASILRPLTVPTGPRKSRRVENL